jgi:hypothetical protein
LVNGKSLRDLVVVVKTFSTTTSYQNFSMRLNGSTTNYSGKIFGSKGVLNDFGVGLTGSNGPTDRFTLTQAAFTSVYNGPRVVVQINDFFATNKRKTIVASAQSLAGGDVMTGSWNDNAAVSSITFFHNAGNLRTGDSLELYGIVG